MKTLSFGDAFTSLQVLNGFCGLRKFSQLWSLTVDKTNTFYFPEQFLFGPMLMDTNVDRWRVNEGGGKADINGKSGERLGQRNVVDV